MAPLELCCLPVPVALNTNHLVVNDHAFHHCFPCALPEGQWRQSLKHRFQGGAIGKDPHN